LVAAVLIKLTDPGPILYRGRRVGRSGDVFRMYKFRTMVVDADRLGSSSTAADDQRITPVGRWLRRWKLDELPQLLNVLSGEMSVVGPRPQVEWDVARYTEVERRLLAVRPGMTDWASIRFRNEGAILDGQDDVDEAYDRLIRPTKLELGLRYVDEASPLTDLRIVVSTVAALFGRDPRLP
jgi:lipopolysaccharide/colanic/teichoic acid biosynthesis glycosyltransferase